MQTSVPSCNDTNVSEHFKPHPWLKSAHLQTLWSRISRYQPRAKFDIEILPTPDGDELDLAWLKGAKTQADAPIVVIFHGLEGSAKSAYADQLAITSVEQGADAVVMQFRTCSGRLNKTPVAYHSGAYEDPLHTLQHIADKYPNRPIHAAGFSLGANMLVNLLGRVENPPIQRAVAVCPPLDLASSSLRMNKGFSRVYRNHLLNSLKQKTYQKLELGIFSDVLDLNPRKLLTCKDFPQFDDCVTAPLHGFQGANEYYEKCSGKQYLRNITTPTLVIHAQDDPLMSQEVIPSSEDLSPQVHYEMHRHGGHVGFITQHEGAAKPWLPGRIMRWFGSEIKAR
ncbi:MULTISPECIES: hydrolase [Gammaproteobacteria]|uniref:hydrolase n=1 Tax=Gammaproteobacteria TaxID=1236 RepID=UPI000DD05812|nr:MULTISPECIES: hydrolase [Gammaproteobacteria]RTE86440.1 hydrolase [Aliidiomarina sp. B3213]TCZ91005.1 hydrolase [Lysobacter sp. N42]